MLICLSGRYIEQELALHYGRIPPAFMPIGAERLFNLHMRRFAAGERVVLTLPRNYNIGPMDQKVLDDFGVEVLRTDPSLNLCDAISAALALVDDNAPVRLLFGDTLVTLEKPLDGQSDYVLVRPAQIEYQWTYCEEIDGVPYFFAEDRIPVATPNAICGYFSFSNIDLLREAFGQGRDHLHEVLNYYSAQCRLKSVIANQWHDFGHLTLFYKSKREVLIARAFNSLEADDYTVIKTSPQTQKMQAEASWFESLPSKVKLHTPRYLGRVNKNFQAGYELEYLHLPTLNDMHVFGRLSPTSWELILSRCLHLLSELRAIGASAEAPEASPDYAQSFFEELFIKKTWSRFEEFCEGRGLSLHTRITLNGTELPPLEQIVATTLSNIPCSQPSDISFWHGDFFFGNLFFDFNTRRTIMVDPRGMLSGSTNSQYGDFRYDIGKLAHSVLGGYDHIIANRYYVSWRTFSTLEFCIPDFETSDHQVMADRFCEMVETTFGLEKDVLYSLAAIMFFSMLPLHNESPDRQDALLATGLRLASKMSI